MKLSELKTFVDEQVHPLIKDNLEKFKDELRGEQEEASKLQTSWMSELTDTLKSLKKKSDREDLPGGVSASRVIRCIAASKGDLDHAKAFAAKTWPEDEYIKAALAATQDTAGGFLIAEEVSRDVIELLRPASVVRSLNPVLVPLNGNSLRLPKMTAGAQGGWIGENQNAPATDVTFGTVNLTPKKYASLVPLSNDLLRRADQSVDTMVRDDMVADLAQSTDVAFIRGDGTGGAPKGLLNVTGKQTFSSAGDTLANMTTDMGTAMQVMMDKNVRMLRPGWIIEPRTWRGLITIRDGNGNLVFKPEMDRGTLWGFPYRVTSQIPRNLGGGSDTEIYFVDFADVIVGEATNVLVAMSDTAAYHDGSSVVASFSLDQTVIRAIVEVDLNARHAESIVVVTGVSYGT